VALARRNRELALGRKRGVDWAALTAPLIATGTFGGFTVA